MNTGSEPGGFLRLEIFPTNLDATADFYTRVLDFHLVRDERHTDSPYLALQRGAFRLGAALRQNGHRDHRRPPTGVEIVLEVDDIDSEHKRVAVHWPLEEGLQKRAWGLRDFRVLDPDGYYLRLTER